jgi:hypothetical protein
MIRKLIGIVSALGLVLTFAGSASAGIFDPGNSYLGNKLGALPLIIYTGAPGSQNLVQLTDDGQGGHRIVSQESVFQTSSYVVNSAAFTGFPALTGLKLSFHSGSGDYADGFSVPNSVGPGSISGFGGWGAGSGTTVLEAGGFFFSIPISVFGAGGTVTLAPVLNNTIVVSGAAFGTGTAVITGITSNLLFVPGRGTTGVAFTLNLTTVEVVSAIEITVAGVVAEVNTVTVSGTNQLNSASQPGMVTLVSPYRLNTGNLSGPGPGAIYNKIVFVPEPGTLLLLISGAAGLAVIGRKRYRK